MRYTCNYSLAKETHEPALQADSQQREYYYKMEIVFPMERTIHPNTPYRHPQKPPPVLPARAKIAHATSEYARLSEKRSGSSSSTTYGPFVAAHPEGYAPSLIESSPYTYGNYAEKPACPQCRFSPATCQKAYRWYEP